MKFKVLIVFVFVFSALSLYAEKTILLTDSLPLIKEPVLDPDSLLEESLDAETGLHENVYIHKFENKITENQQPKVVTSVNDSGRLTNYYNIPAYIEPIKIDSLILQGNPLFIDLVFMGHSKKMKFEFNPDFQTLYFGQKASAISSLLVKSKGPTIAEIITDLRVRARDEITRTAADVYIMSYDQLPDPNGTKSHFIAERSLPDIKLNQDYRLLNAANRKLFIRKEKLGPWEHKANSLLQFSQNMASDNWYQGGSSTMSVLGVLSGQLNYDNKNNIQWENYGEWRMGINAVFNDSTAKRAINTNDDVFKINSKLGIKAGENLFYSGSVDVSTQFFHNYKAVSSDVMKASFLTPVRLNIGMGLDYKYKKLLSVMLAPVSYKYIYIDDNVNVSPNLFGIKTGENHLSEIGSSLKAQLSYSPFRELQLDSKFSFYTNYEKVEIDWEIVGNFTINRYLSTRISLNPRYDNTVIFAAGEKARIQFKELLSFGFSYKLLN
jgi:hypothetical protein